MNTLKKLDEKFSKYIGFAFSLVLIWLIKRGSTNLANPIYCMSLLVSGFILRELVVKHKNKINKPLLACVLVPNFIIAITAVILQLLNPTNEANQYMYATRVIAIILIVTLPISCWILSTEIEKAR